MKSHAGHEEELPDAAPTFAVLHFPALMGQTF